MIASQLGRVYVDHRWDGVEVPHIMLNGKWVMDLPLEGAWLVGASSREVDTLLYTDADRCKHSLKVSDKPFGYILAEGKEFDRMATPPAFRPTGRKRLVYAQQIHKGELGRSVPIPPLDYVRQPFEAGQKPSVTKAHQRRRGYGWVKLADLGEMAVGYNPDEWIELVLGYWEFSGHRDYDGRDAADTLVDTIWGSIEDIRHGRLKVVSMTPEEFRKEASLDTSEMWIRRGFAFTILRLQALGVEPSVKQTA